MDRISKLPIGIIETILCLLPIQEAARTSILSKEWRYRWTKIPKLVFIQDRPHPWTDEAELAALEQYRDRPSERRKLFYAIYQVLLIHEGPIHEFTLDMEVDGSCVEIDHFLHHLSKKNTLKILKLDLDAGAFDGHRLPICLFSLHQLTSLYLHGCVLYEKHSFNEFGCLTTLHVENVCTPVKTLLRLLSSCPLLKSLTLDVERSLVTNNGDTTFVDLFKCLPVIDYLYFKFFTIECFVPERLPKELPTALAHLKYLCLDNVCFIHKYGLPFLALLIRSSPNLEKLELVMYFEDWLGEDEIGSFTLEDYSDIMLEHLIEFEMQQFMEAEHELDFVKLILAKSPALKKVSVFACFKFDEGEVEEILKMLYLSPRASPAVKIMLG
ncbi:F-box/FBD/LRR-repeat protein At1g13570-like [Helianthus annuus]|uniref:F-box/FBD/LRR-repeat protein At1g13570-like n=1 Tax=Helianthus annuus TaxID=4232 RepID=UPI000B8F1F38|nr:F-box/FBD/LRR-repeat protein At1g13570-like [Helianthus annuus]